MRRYYVKTNGIRVITYAGHHSLPLFVKVICILHTVYHQLHHCKGGFSLSAYTQQFHNVLVIKHLHCFCLAEKFKLLRKKHYKRLGMCL